MATKKNKEPMQEFVVEKSAIVFDGKRREIGETVMSFPSDSVLKILVSNNYLVKKK